MNRYELQEGFFEIHKTKMIRVINTLRESVRLCNNISNLYYRSLDEEFVQNLQSKSFNTDYSNRPAKRLYYGSIGSNLKTLNMHASVDTVKSLKSITNTLKC